MFRRDQWEVKGESKGKEVFLDIPAHPEQWDPKVCREFADPLVDVDLQGEKDSLEIRALKVHLDYRGQKVKGVMQDRKDKTETQARKGPLGIRVLLAVLDHMDLLDQWASPGIVDRMEKLESQECKEFLEGRDLWDLQGEKDSLEIEDPQARKGPPGIRVLLAVLDHMDLLDQWASLGTTARMVKLVSQD